MKLTLLQTELLLTWFANQMTQEQRDALAKEMPQVYLAFVGATRVELHYKSANGNANKRVSARRGKT